MQEFSFQQRTQRTEKLSDTTQDCTWLTETRDVWFKNSSETPEFTDPRVRVLDLIG